MTIYNPYDSTASYIVQIEQHIQMLQHLVQSLKLSNQRTRMQSHPFGQSIDQYHPSSVNYQDRNNIWKQPGFQQQSYPMGGIGGTSNTGHMSERDTAFRFFDQHKDAFAPIQNLFNQSMTGGFANSFGPRTAVDSKTGVSGIDATWVEEVQSSCWIDPCETEHYDLLLTNSRGHRYTRTYELQEFAQATANNGVLNTLLSAIASSPSNIDGQAWKVDGRYIVSIKGVGSFVADADIVPLLRFGKPYIEVTKSRPVPQPMSDPRNAPTLVISSVIAKHGNAGEFEVFGSTDPTVTTFKPTKFIINVLDLPKFLYQPGSTTSPTPECTRIAWILTKDTVLTLLESNGKCFNEIITVSELGNYPNTRVEYDYREGMENIPFDFPIMGAVEDLREVEITRITSLDQDLTSWFNSSWAIDQVERVKEDELLFTLNSTINDRRHKLEITDELLGRWFEDRKVSLTDGWTFNRISTDLSENSQQAGTIVTFESLNGAIVQILSAVSGEDIRLYTTDLKRAIRFADVSSASNTRWIRVE